MAKRFVDTTRWDQPWFRKIGARGRDIWNWLHDRCDSAGVWEVDLERMSFEVGYTVTMEEIKAVFCEKIYDLGSGKVWLPKFIPFQYGTLSKKSRAQLGIMKRIALLSADLPSLDEQTAHLIESFKTLTRGSDDSLLTPQEEEEVEEADNGSGEEDTFRVRKSDLEAIYALYPRKVGKSRGFDRAKRELKTLSDVEDLMRAVKNYRAYCERERTEAKFIKHFNSFIGEWRDWLAADHGSAEQFGGAKEPDLGGIFADGAL